MLRNVRPIDHTPTPAYAVLAALKASRVTIRTHSTRPAWFAHVLVNGIPTFISGAQRSSDGPVFARQHGRDFVVVIDGDELLLCPRSKTESI